MISISHRGYWLTHAEKNSFSAFNRSFSQGFGTETDIRDYKGKLVISHDVANEQSIPFGNFLELFTYYNSKLPLALNIKSDGLAKEIYDHLKFYGIDNYFCFDMSIPDTLSYLKENMNVYMRRSEYENENELFQCAKGIWLDSFKSDDFQMNNILCYLLKGKSVCIVSPELHKRDEVRLWGYLKTLPQNLLSSDKLMICTDKVEQAGKYFNES